MKQQERRASRTARNPSCAERYVSNPVGAARKLPQGRATYGLGRREGPRIWTYAPECRVLTDADRTALHLTFTSGQTCLLETRAQRRTAMAKAVERGMHPNEYYEAVARPVREASDTTSPEGFFSAFGREEAPQRAEVQTHADFVQCTS